MALKLLFALEFRSNNDRHRPVMQALELVKSKSLRHSGVRRALRRWKISSWARVV